MSNDRFENVYAVIQEYATKLVTEYKARLPQATGQLISNLTGNVVVEDNVYSVVIDGSEVWKYIEEGRQPGKYPPPDAIKEWIRVKGIIPQPYTLPSGKQAIPSENQLAFLISRKIARDGIEARPYMAQTIEALQNELFTKLSEALNKDVIKEIQEAFQNKK